MKNKTLIMLLTLFITGQLLSCNSNSAIKTYTNKGLRSSQYARLMAPTGVLILEIDGHQIDYAKEYHVLPGKHKLFVMVSAFKGEQAYKVAETSISFYATAEHTYHVKSLATKIQRKKDFNRQSDEFLWIEDKTLDTVVAGTKP